MNKLLIAVIIAIIVIVGVVALRSQDKTENGDAIMEENGEMMEEEGDKVMEGESMMDEKVTITMTETGFSPKSITVKKGTEVAFMNKGTIDQWPASAIHPTHRVYPNSDIENCDTAPEGTMFDACEGIAPGESWNFTFNEVGEWKYHDHLNATLFGTVVVEE